MMSEHAFPSHPSHQAELILECLEVSSQYEAELSKVESADKAPSLPLVMQAYNCTNTDDFLLETFKRVRARYNVYIYICIYVYRI